MTSGSVRRHWFASSALAVAATLLSCAAGLCEPTAADAERLRASYGDSSLEELSRGRDHYVASCSGCHALKDPERSPSASWRAEVRRMREKFGVSLAPADAEAIIRYLEAVSSRGAR